MGAANKMLVWRKKKWQNIFLNETFRYTTKYENRVSGKMYEVKSARGFGEKMA